MTSTHVNKITHSYFFEMTESKLVIHSLSQMNERINLQGEWWYTFHTCTERLRMDFHSQRQQDSDYSAQDALMVVEVMSSHWMHSSLRKQESWVHHLHLSHDPAMQNLHQMPANVSNQYVGWETNTKVKGRIFSETTAWITLVGTPITLLQGPSWLCT